MTTRPFWWTFAACAPQWADRPLDQWVDLWFPPGDAKSPEAVAICEECPAREACLDHALAHNEPGIRGALTEGQRHHLRLDLLRRGALPKLCRRCGDRFTVGKATKRDVFCSDECRTTSLRDAAAREAVLGS